MNDEFASSQRRERRFTTCDQALLQTETFIEFDEPVQGTVIDISAHGIRLLAKGNFAVGQAFVTELKTDRLHGVYSGIVRNIEPWVEGKSVLGCQLLEAIPDDVLENLARKDIINRRDDDRVDWRRSAKLSWELQPGEVDIAIQDCSLGGMRISTETAVPENVCVRVKIDVGGGEQVTIDARTAWQNEDQEGCTMGLAFTKHEVPPIITRAVAQGSKHRVVTRERQKPGSLRRSLMVAATALICIAAIWQIGILG